MFCIQCKFLAARRTLEYGITLIQRSAKYDGEAIMIRASSCIAAAVLGVFATTAAAQIADFRPVTDAILANPDPADWLMISRTFDQQRYSPLDQIDKGNVGQLRMAWSRGLPNGTQESTPIVYRGIMYLNAPGASIQAVAATNGDLIWEYQREYPRTVTPAAARAKSLGIYEDMIYFAAPDGFLLALDAKTGKLRWETKVDNGGQTAGGLLVADGKVISNRTCEQSQRENCFIAAHDARTGKEVWRFYTTAAPGEPGGDTWADMPVQERAASPWGLPGSYDPKRKVLYWGVANPNPYTRLARQPRQALPEGRRQDPRVLPQYAQPVGYRLSSGKEFALRPVPGPMPDDDREQQGEDRLGAARGRHPPGIRPEQIHEHRENRPGDGRDARALLAAASERRLGARHRGRSRLLGRPEPPASRVRRRQRQDSLGNGGRRHGHDQHHQLRGGREAVRDGVHRRRPVGHGGAAGTDAEIHAESGARAQLHLRLLLAVGAPCVC